MNDHCKAKFDAPMIARFGVSGSSLHKKWRCYNESVLTEDTYYFQNGSAVKTRRPQLNALIDGYDDVKIGGYELGAKGESCGTVCNRKGKQCSSDLVALDSIYLFFRLGITCSYNKSNKDCFTHDAHPIYYPHTGFCEGFINVPESYDCTSGSVPNGQRLCKCVEVW